MANINMANMNTLFRKGYLLAGVIMAANMFIVDEIKAMEDGNNSFDNDDTGEKQGKTGAQIFRDVLLWPSTINFIGGLVSSVANNYFKCWNYDAGIYYEFGCLGYRTKRFLNGIFQFNINLNLGRCTGWLIFALSPYVVTKYVRWEEAEFPRSCITDTIKRALVSVPLALHIYNFSISISFDSILWMVIDTIYYIRVEMGKENYKKLSTGEMINGGNS